MTDIQRIERPATARPHQRLHAFAASRHGKLGALAAIAATALAWGLTAVEPAQAEAVPVSAHGTVSYGDQIAQRSGAIAVRQQAIAQITDVHFADAAMTPVAGEQLETAPASAARIAGLLPELPGLTALEQAQTAQVDALTRMADAGAAKAERAIRRAGLNPRLVMAKVDDHSAQGGPLEALSEGEPGLVKLGQSVARLSALQLGLDKLPTHLPAALDSMTSNFGYRSDPFTGHGAMHAGLDFRGPIGTPIQAAADGTVTFVGVKSGYGNVVEVTHGNGMMTRYAHMSKFKARAGQKVAAGDTIGAIGSTGRSTGPHLHFEVRVNGAAVNPRPFLEART